MVDGVEANANKLDPEPEPNPVRVMWALIGGVLGGAAVFFLQAGHLSLKPATMTFEQFAAILLTAVAVIVTVFGAVFAILAFWGFRQIKDNAVAAAESAGTAEVKGQISTGPLREYVHDEIDKIIKTEIASEEMERRIEERVTEIVLGNRRDRELDNEGNEHGE